MVGFEVHGVLVRLQAAGAGIEVQDDRGDDTLRARLRVDGAWVDVAFPSHARLEEGVIRVLQLATAGALAGAGYGVALRRRNGTPVAELGLAPGEADGDPALWIGTLEGQLRTWLRLAEHATPDAGSAGETAGRNAHAALGEVADEDEVAGGHPGAAPDETQD